MNSLIEGLKSPAEDGIQTAAIGFALGVLLIQQLSTLPPFWAALPALPLLLATYRRPALQRWLLAALAGFLWAWLNAVWQLDRRLDPHLEGRDLLLTGVVVGLPETRDGNARFLLRVESLGVDGPGAAFSGKVRLSWYRNPPTLVAGERWRLMVRLKAPHGFANPGGFDYAGWLYREGILATGYVRPDGNNRRLDPGGISLDRTRQWLRQQLLDALGGSGAQGLVLALTLGDRSGLKPSQWEVLTRTGTSHLIAISGLHVGIVAALAFFLVRSLWRRAVWLNQRLATDRAAALGALCLAAAYAGLAGFAVSTQRALIMLAVLFGAQLLRRTLRPLAAVLLVDPTACLSPGFWLSFTAVGVLAYGMSGRAGPNGLHWRWGRAQWLVALGLAPLLFLLFGRASAIAPLVNLLLVPLFSVLLLPWVLIGTLLVLVAGWPAPLLAVAWVLDQGSVWLALLAQQPWAVWTLSEKPGWVWLSACIGVILLLAPRGLPGRWTGLLLLLPLLLVQPQGPRQGEFHFSLLDVGQGLAAVVRTREHVLVYDTGPRFPSGFNAGTAVVAPFLRARGLKSIDLLMVSHADIDHAGGVQGLLGEMPVERILAGEPDEITGSPVQQCLAGTHWDWNGVGFRILHPSHPLTPGGNNRSCVLQVTNQGGRLLLTGDAEAGVERALELAESADLRSQVLVAGHHGSATSTSARFLAAVQPEWVLFSAGYRNRYGFPRPQVVQRVRNAGARTAGTTTGGALEIRFGPGRQALVPVSYRSANRRYWSHQTTVLSAGDSGYDALR